MSWMVEYETKRGVRDDSKWKDSVAITWDAEVREEHVLGEKNQELCFGHVEISINPSGDFGKAVDKWNWSSGESWRWRWTFGSCQHVERRVDRENKRSKDWALGFSLIRGGSGRCRRSQQNRGSGHGSKRKPGMLACWKSGEEALLMILICSSVK